MMFRSSQKRSNTNRQTEPCQRIPYRQSEALKQLCCSKKLFRTRKLRTIVTLVGFCGGAEGAKPGGKRTWIILRVVGRASGLFSFEDLVDRYSRDPPPTNKGYVVLWLDAKESLVENQAFKTGKHSLIAK